MRRILYMVFRNFFFLPYIWWQLCHYSKKADNYTKEQRRAVLYSIVRRANTGGRVTIKTYGRENIPKENGFVMFPNHQGLYDVLAIVEACPIFFSVIYKKEVGNNPFLKRVFAIMKAYCIDREDVRQSMNVIMSVTKDVLAGDNFVIFPEGTRSKNGNEVNDFKGGSFKSATKAKSPIIPVALIDSFKPFDSKSIKPVTVQVHFLPPMYYEEYKDMKTTEIAAEVKSRIEKVIHEYEN